MTKAELIKRYKADMAKLRELHSRLQNEYQWHKAQWRTQRDESQGASDTRSEVWQLYHEGWFMGISESMYEIDNIARNSAVENL